MPKAARKHKGKPTVSQVTNEAAVVLRFFLKNASVAPHKKAKRTQVNSDEFVVARSTTAVLRSKSTPKLQSGETQILTSKIGHSTEHEHEKKAAASSTVHVTCARAEVYDEHDGMPTVAAVQMDVDVRKKFSERTISENEDIFEKVADELARMADELDWQAMTKGPIAKVNTSTTQASPSSSSEKKRTQEQTGLARPPLPVSNPVEVVNGLVKDCTYTKFEQVMHQNIGQQVDWNALAQMFRLSQVAMQRVGTGSTNANDIQKFMTRYFQDRFAPWLVEQGGWDSVINRTEFNEDLD